jgi:abhydrolase domain-containing protein 17
VKSTINSLFIGEFSWKRVIRSALLIPVFVYIGLFMLAWIVPNKLIFRPPGSSYKDGSEIVRLQTADGEIIAAKFYENESAAYTILFSHGNAEDIGNIDPFVRQLRDAGFAVLTFDYRGYGLSEGSPSEEKVYKDIQAAYYHLVKNRNVPAERIILHGRSLGGAAAVDLAARYPVGGLILESTFTSAARILTGFRILPFDKFDNLAKIAAVTCPVLVIHGKLDTTIPFDHSEKLFVAANDPKTSLWIENAGHNDLFYRARQTYLIAIMDFSQSLP